MFSSSSLPPGKNSETETDIEMSVSDPLLDSYNCPAFLRCCNAYREYLVKTEARELKLPLYTTASLYEEN
jgi:hypothetical protein